MMGRVLFIFCVFSLFAHLFAAKTQVKPKSLDTCENAVTCGECFSTDVSCAWCQDEVFKSTRCNSYESLLNDSCANIYPKKDEKINSFKLLQDKELSSISARYDASIVQIRPQRVALKMRPKTSTSFNISFRLAVDYPVDLYYLMDLSWTMRDDKETLANVGDNLAKEMKEITKNFRLGFGSFVDKQVMPFVDLTGNKLDRPCPGCVRTYGFRNHMPLNEDTSKFRSEIKSSPISGNLDGPEGGLDALMQVMACTEKIGWREQSRKLLVYATDASFHYAGDGRLGGILKPNDEQCHLNEKGYYTESNTQDYPSINQINMIAQNKSVYIIFAVTASESKEKLYKLLSSSVQGSSVASLASDSSNIVDLIKEAYNSITSSLVIKHNLTDESEVQIKFSSACLDGEFKKRSSCSGIRVGEKIDFTVELEVLNCPEKKSERNQTIKINPLNLSDELLIDLHIECECDCAKPGNAIVNSNKCNKGTLECGICACNEGYYGEQCECELNSGKINDDKNCYKGNDTKACSGNGECSCGRCLCKEYKKGEAYYGKYCECDRVSCKRFNGEVCGGSDHGPCDCGKCVCNSKWQGDACQCSTNTDTCIDPLSGSGQICSGNGKCVCGKCECENNLKNSKAKEIYTGTYCENCPTCSGHCNYFREMVMNQINSAIEEVNEGENVTLNLVGEVQAGHDEKLCELLDDKKCKVIFKYTYVDKLDREKKKIRKLVLFVQRTKQCPEPRKVGQTVISISGGILLFGILLLILWKLITVWHDKREFERFEKELKKANWEASQNPIFKPSTAQFDNPTFGRTSVYQ